MVAERANPGTRGPLGSKCGRRVRYGFISGPYRSDDGEPVGVLDFALVGLLYLPEVKPTDHAADRPFPLVMSVAVRWSSVVAN